MAAKFTDSVQVEKAVYSCTDTQLTRNYAVLANASITSSTGIACCCDFIKHNLHNMTANVFIIATLPMYKNTNTSQ